MSVIGRLGGSAVQAILLVTIVGAGNTVALADGKIFTRLEALPTNVVTPDQRALIRFDNGRQYLAIETKFDGPGKELAWVVPLPNVPDVIEPVTTGLFPTLRWQFRPEIVARITHWWKAAILLLILAWLVTMRDRMRLVTALALLLFAVVMTGILLPSLGGVRSQVTTHGNVTVHHRKIVGAFDTAVIEGRDADALLGWLADNGFHTPTGVKPVVQQYADEDWIFVASRLARDQAEGTSTPHPLGFEFETDRCVYPLRLTGVDNGPVAVELYVLGNGRASADGFNVRHCTRLRYYNELKPTPLPHVQVEHLELERVARRAPILTKLVARLTEDQMHQDLAVEFSEFSAHRTILYTDDAANLTFINVLVVVLTVAFIPVAGLDVKKLLSGWPLLYLCVAVMIAAVSAGVTRSRLDIVEATVGRPAWMEAQRVHASLRMELEWMANRIRSGRELPPRRDLRPIELPADAPPISLERLHEIMGDLTGGRYPGYFAADQVNPYDGHPIRREDSPGNYDLREYTVDGTVWYTWYDGTGKARETILDIPVRGTGAEAERRRTE